MTAYIETIVANLTHIASSMLRRLRGSRVPRILLLPPAASSSLGDQAMLDAACHALTQKSTATVSILKHYPRGNPAPVRPPGTVINASPTRASRMIQILWALTAADAIGTLGADIIDGTYNPHIVSFKPRLARMILNLGGVAVVFGSSISETPNPGVMRTLRATEDLTLFARDKISLARFRRQLGRTPGLTADIAFLLRPGIDSENGKAAAEWVERKRAAGQTVMAANASGHTVARAGVGSVKAYACVLKDWLEKDSARAVLLVPHDSRLAPTGDVEPVSHIYDELASLFEDRIQAVRFPVNAW